MPNLLKTSILSALLCLSLSACGSTPKVEPPIIVKTIAISPPAPIVPSVDQLKMRPLVWSVLTPSNSASRFSTMKPGETSFFALDSEGYKSLALNLNDIRSLVRQQQVIIDLYKHSFNK